MPLGTAIMAPVSSYTASYGALLAHRLSKRQLEVGFGCFLFMAHNWAPWAETKRSYELFARYVLPKFEERSAWREQSMTWMRENREGFSAKRKAATASAVERHFAEAKRDRPAAK